MSAGCDKQFSMYVSMASRMDTLLGSGGSLVRGCWDGEDEALLLSSRDSGRLARTPNIPACDLQEAAAMAADAASSKLSWDLAMDIIVEELLHGVEPS